MRYSCNGKVYEASSLDEAWLMALDQQGVEALGGCVKSMENSDFFCHVCLEAYERYFPQFSVQDFIEYEKATTYAWLNFDHVIGHGYDFEGEYTTEKIVDEGLDYIRSHSPLAKHMDDIGFCW